MSAGTKTCAFWLGPVVEHLVGAADGSSMVASRMTRLSSPGGGEVEEDVGTIVDDVDGLQVLGEGDEDDDGLAGLHNREFILSIF